MKKALGFGVVRCERRVRELGRRMNTLYSRLYALSILLRRTMWWKVVSTKGDEVVDEASSKF